MIMNYNDKLWTLSRNSERLLYNGSLYFPAQGPFLAPRPCSWTLAPAPGPGLQFVLRSLALNLFLPLLVPNLYLPPLAPNLYLPTLTETLYLLALVPKLCLPTLIPAIAPNLY